MRLSRIKVKNYRSFLDADLELRPLTLIYGDNNSGKSALLRLLPVLGQSIGKLDGAALPSDLHAMRGGGTESMISTLVGSVPGLSQWLTITLQIGPYLSTWTFDQDRDVVRVRTLEIESGNESFRLDVFSGDDESEDDGFLRYFLNDDIDRIVRLKWRGLYPDVSHGVDLPTAWGDALKEVGRSVQWIDALRKGVQRRYKVPSPAPRWLMPDGGDAPRALWGNDVVLGVINDWYANCFGRHISLQREVAQSDEFRVEVGVADRVGYKELALADGGEGLGQVLPVITALALSRQEGSPVRYLALEEPESHLHATHHEDLLNEILKSVRSNNNPIIVVETHSQEMLLATMLAVANGDLSHDDVIVHYVYKDITPYAATEVMVGRSSLVSETFDAHGRPSKGVLPKDIFMSSSVLSSRLFAAQRRV